MCPRAACTKALGLDVTRGWLPGWSQGDVSLVWVRPPPAPRGAGLTAPGLRVRGRQVCPRAEAGPEAEASQAPTASIDILLLFQQMPSLKSFPTPYLTLSLCQGRSAPLSSSGASTEGPWTLSENWRPLFPGACEGTIDFCFCWLLSAWLPDPHLSAEEGGRLCFPLYLCLCVCSFSNWGLLPSLWSSQILKMLHCCQNLGLLL